MAFPAAAATPCSLDITLACPSGNCTSTTRNIGSTMCTGEYVIALFVDAEEGQATVSNFTNTLGLTQCFDASNLPIGIPFAACIGNASLGPGNSFTITGQARPGAGAPADLPIVAVTFVQDPLTADELAFVYAFNNLSVPTCTTRAMVPSGTQSGVSYDVSWTPVSESNATFTIEEATDLNFTQNVRVVSQTAPRLSEQFQHTVSTATTFHYRVHANSCAGAVGPNSSPVTIIVQPVPTVTGRSGDAAVPLGSNTPIQFNVFIPGQSGKQALADVPFTAATDKPYLTVSPSSGTIPPGGTTLTVTANPSNLPPGANTGTLTVTSNNNTVATKSLSVSLVTPTTPGGKTLPPANALVIPAVAHAPGALGPFQSDVRLTNGSAATVSYQVTFTPTRSDGTKTGKSTTINVDAGQTIALNDILRDFFGVGATDNPADQGQGALEIRPLNSTTLQNYAASRTFTFNERGTFGQFIAAIPFSAFATKASLIPLPGPTPAGNPVLSLQQVAQSGKFRTNFGLVEGSGSPAAGTINVYDARGTLVKAIPYSLQPGEHQQMSLPALGVTSLDDGRIGVTVESSTGAVTAYASVLDNITNDPLAVTPVQVAQINSPRYVLPGMAALGGVNNFHSDIRIYNGGNTSTTVNATFYPQGGGTPRPAPAPITIGSGEMKAFDDVVASLFNANGLGGSIVFTTAAPSSLVATGRTYTIDERNGTFGQFIPGITPAQGIGLGDRALQVLQLEQSTNFRSNLGLAELNGNPVRVRVTAFVPDSKIAPSTEIDLAPFEFRQLGRVLSSFGLGENIYNARISVEVVSGIGRVTSYGSVIDNASLDPTYVQPQ
jgi:hypothetical protein